jgi:signal transduction histidine kinase
MTKTLLTSLRRPLDPETRASLAILVAARWFLIAIAVFTVNYQPAVGIGTLVGLDLLIVAASVLNIVLQLRLRGGQPVTVGVPTLAAVYDAAAITIAIALVDGFANNSFVLYYPALLAICVVFPGRWSILYAVVAAVAYLYVCLLVYDGSQPVTPGAQRVMVLRLSAMAATVLIANLVVRIERDRRGRAVAAEAAKAEQVLVLEQRARDAERTAELERRRLSQEVHDGIAQQIYMLTLGLETAAAVMPQRVDADHTVERMDALLRLAKQTLLDTRNLLFDLERVMAGQSSLDALVRHQAEEFAAITGIPIHVQICGAEHRLSPATVGEVYRVVQEGLANIYKHANARAATLRLEYGEHDLTLTITDDGQGFDPAGIRTHGHGITNMQDRAARLGGRLSLTTTAGQGTTLTVVVPNEPNEETGDAIDPRAAG